MRLRFDLLSRLMYSAAPTAPPENLIATPLDSRTLHITWQPPVEEEKNGIIRRYVINITELNSGNDFQLENATTEITVQNLHPFYRYSYSVAAETVALGPFTPGSIFEMPEDGKLTKVYLSENIYIQLSFISHALQHHQLHLIILLPQTSPPFLSY